MLPWIEKYRPSRIKDIILNDNIKKELEQMLNKKCMNNIIITGSPGIGKTTTVKCFANELYGPYYKNYVLEFNASDDRGIKIQSDITNFCRSVIYYKSADKNKYANHKLIIMDEADNITNKAQRLINNIMEQYKYNIKFVFTCNSSNKIIQSIQSKCKIIRYPRISNRYIIERLMYICKVEKVVFDNAGLAMIAQISLGDMRNAINILNITFNKSEVVNEISVLDIYDKPYPSKLKEIFKKCITDEYVSVLNGIIDIKNEGFCGKDIVLCMFYVLKSEICNDIEESIKIKFLKILSETIYIISKGVDSDLQLYSCMIKMAKIKYDA